MCPNRCAQQTLFFFSLRINNPPAFSLRMMYESVDVVGLNPSPNPFLMMDYYNQSRGCLIPEKGLVPGAPHHYSTSIRNQHWNGSNHCRWHFHCLVHFISLTGEVHANHFTAQLCHCFSELNIHDMYSLKCSEL